MRLVNYYEGEEITIYTVRTFEDLGETWVTLENPYKFPIDMTMPEFKDFLNNHPEFTVKH